MRTVKYYFSRSRFALREAKYSRYKSPSCCQKRTPRHIFFASNTVLCHTVNLLCTLKLNFHKFNRSSSLACVGTARFGNSASFIPLRARSVQLLCERAYPLLPVTPLNFIAVVKCIFPLFYLTSCCNK